MSCLHQVYVMCVGTRLGLIVDVVSDLSDSTSVKARRIDVTIVKEEVNTYVESPVHPL